MPTTFLVPRNNANSKLAAAITASATSLSVLSGEGARFPSTFPFHITIDNEILQVTGRSSDTLTVTRAQESTTAASHKAGANVQLNITAKAISDLNAAVNSLEVVPPAHNTTHQSGGSDQISLAGLTGEAVTPQPPKAHKSSHQSGGSDQISLTGLTGESATAQPPKAHASNHKLGGSDAIKLDELATPDDNTNLNASISRHGLLSKLPNNSTLFLNGVGSWVNPASGVGGEKSARAYSIYNFTTSHNSWTALPLESERWDNDDIHDNSSNTSRLTCRTAGKYLISGQAHFASGGGLRAARIRLNGGTDIAFWWGYPPSVYVETLYDLSVNDYVEFMVLQSSGGNLQLLTLSNYSPEFMMIRIN